MAIVGIERLVYAVEDLEASRRFFEDFGLVREEADGEAVSFLLPEGSRVVLLPWGHHSLPKGSRVCGPGVHEVIWGVDSHEGLEKLVEGLAPQVEVRRGADGVARFVPSFGVAMGLTVFTRKPVVCAPDPQNAPGHLRRLNQHRKWRRRALPKVIAHVVFAVPDFDSAYGFMIQKLNFRLTDHQRGFGIYLRADGTCNHHNFLLLNANAPLPDMDGKVKFHHANFGVEDIDEIMVGANYMVRHGWEPSHFGLGRHRIDSALFYYLPCPAGGEAEYGADSDCVDDSWVPRDWDHPLFAYAHYVHNLPPFLRTEPVWNFNYLGPEGASGVKT
jgi:catechol 2,3-dioxygenase-like lactoylglutathione lyase family enzyme